MAKSFQFHLNCISATATYCHCEVVYDRASHVPVGEDQLQHLELARDIARSFNSAYSPVFTEPQPLLGKEEIIGSPQVVLTTASCNNTAPPPPSPPSPSSR